MCSPRQAVPPSWAPSLHPSTSAFIGHEPVYQTGLCLLSVLNPVTISNLLGNLIVNGLWYTFLKSILSDPICKMGSCTISWDYLVWPMLVDLGFKCWVVITWRGSPRRTSIAAVGVIVIAPLIAKQANLCNLLNCVLLTLLLTLGHQTMELWVHTFLITMV